MKAIIAALALLTLLGSAQAAERRFEQRYDLAPGAQISLENINGDVTLEGWDRDYVELAYRIVARREADLERVDVDIRHDPESLRVDIDFEQSRSWWGGGGPNASVYFDLRVPSNVKIRQLDTVNGDVSLRGVSGDVNAETVNGRLSAHGLRGDASLATVNGRIEAHFERFQAGQAVSIETVNGAMVVSLPESADVEINAQTVNGSLKNDFGISVDKGRYVGESMRGRVGQGSATLELETVNGGITIRRY